jgi:hypothetical protein
VDEIHRLVELVETSGGPGPTINRTLAPSVDNLDP